MSEVAFFEVAPGVMEGAKLDGDTGADADKGGESAFVEGQRAFMGEDLFAAVKCRCILVGSLETDFYDVCGDVDGLKYAQDNVPGKITEWLA